MNAFMDMDNQLEKWLANEPPPELLAVPLPDSFSNKVVERLKSEADRYWDIDPNQSLQFANRIIAIGEARKDTNQIALGMMARGDAMHFLGQMHEAWDMLGQAGNMFEKAGNEVGWARTRIGRIILSLDLNRVSEAFTDAERAREIFTRYNDEDKLLRLDLQTAAAHNHLGNQQQALELYNSALARANALGKQGQKYLGVLYLDIGVTFTALGDFNQALIYYQKAQDLAIADQETLVVAHIECSIADILYLQGHYKRALTLLNSALEQVKNESPLEAAMIQHHMVECYLSLNRYAEARLVGQEAVQAFRKLKAEFHLARMLLYLATAEGATGNFLEAETALREAEEICSSIGAKSWEAIIHLWRGRMALRQHNAITAYQEAVTAAVAFEADGQQMKTAEANLLQGQALLALGNLQASTACGERALGVAQRHGVSTLRYKAHSLLGEIAEAQNQYERAAKRYQAAVATINRVQRELTITLRPDFLEDKSEASHHLISLYLQTDQTVKAFESLENAKAQNWLAYLNHGERLHWSKEDTVSRALIKELEDLRAEHQSFYQLANHLPGDHEEYPKAITPEHALAEMRAREKRMRTITEQLYLRNEDDQQAVQAFALSFKTIQETLDDHSTLIEYYNNGETVWAFTLNRSGIRVHRLPVTVQALNHLVEQWQVNVAGAVKMDPQADSTQKLTMLARRILHRLYASLIQPLDLKGPSPRLVFVPYGMLHFLPFHLLYDSTNYLIEKHEMVILPAAGLITRQPPKRTPGVLALAHSWDGKLPRTATEAQVVQKLFGGRLLTEEQVHRAVLAESPVQILHIATHGQHRLDQPDLSFLQLADGQLYADDVMQQDLSYELVTLSACETGRARIATSDDLIGIGRSFLFAGAGALVLSLWQVEDQSTLQLMERLYAALYAGESKPSALRQAQLSLLAENKNLHPAFWGAFQVVGNADPLSR
ncbi:MAG TPA: CHAT domain-containing tetratricopeptide repeat protein [Anaerolineales bacterium]|nr:CHAT domain-containing tetratricopeptide repeat protein [Anaerolineales bacterium]